MQVTYRQNGNSLCGATLNGLDAPTESEVLKALYKNTAGHTKYEVVEIRNSFLTDCY